MVIKRRKGVEREMRKKGYDFAGLFFGLLFLIPSMITGLFVGIVEGFYVVWERLIIQISFREADKRFLKRQRGMFISIYNPIYKKKRGLRK